MTRPGRPGRSRPAWRRYRQHGLALLLLLTGLALLAPTGAVPLAPGQPGDDAPGGGVYRHAGVREREIGLGHDKYFLLEPTDPTPASAPLILFLHGELYTHPDNYRGWLVHLVRRGAIVLFPCYQGADGTGRWLTSVARSYLDGLRELERGPHVRPDRRRVAAIGHGCGGLLAVNLAATSVRFGVPRPWVLVACNPTAGTGSIRDRGLQLRRLDGLREGTLLLVVTGDDDVRQDYELAVNIYYGASNLRSDDRGFVILRQDLHGKPALVADHASAQSRTRNLGERYIERQRAHWVTLMRQNNAAAALRGRDRDTLDWNGYWKLADGLLAAGFAPDPDERRRGRAFALGETGPQRYMGQHSDGRPVVPLLSDERP